MDTLPDEVVKALHFEQQSQASASPEDDLFYSIQGSDVESTPGTLLKVEADTDQSKYMLPPATAMSRFIYQSRNLNGQPVPVSAFVLWPFTPRNQKDGYAVVAWAHGTSGITPESAPSKHRCLWQHFLAPYQLAAQGYVVVATDYAGLGVRVDALGRKITHEYLAGPSHANDIIYSVRAARSAFPELSKDFIVIGHSQGGFAAWSAAQRQSNDPVPGFLGAISISPGVSIVLDHAEPLLSVLGVAISPALAAVYSDIDMDDILTESGLESLRQSQMHSLGIASSSALLMGREDLLKPNWTSNKYVQDYEFRSSIDNKSIAVPFLVFHGNEDKRLPVDKTTSAVRKLAKLCPSASIEYVTLPYTSHVSSLQASQTVWMDWIAERFAGKEAGHGFRQRQLHPARPGSAYQTDVNWYLERATEPYHAP